MKTQFVPQRTSIRSDFGNTWLPLLVLLSVVGGLHQLRSWYKTDKDIAHSQTAYHCHAPLPNLFANNPPSLNDDAIAKTAARLELFLAERTSHNDIDSLVVAVGTSDGPLWFKGYGATRANESLSGPAPDLDTIYRLASVSKMFTALDTLILRDRGYLNWYGTQ